MNPDGNRVKRVLKLCAILLTGAIALGCARKPLHPLYQQTKGWYRNKLAQALDSTRWVESPSAHHFLPDFAQLGGYQAANRALPTIAPGRVVFYGDSITDFWPTAYKTLFFPGRPYIGRGIAGQSTPELVWRFQQDVIDLHPTAVVLLAGSNDVVLPERHITFQQTTRNIQAMVEMAQRRRIRVILCSIPPVSNHPPPQQAVLTGEIRALNLWLQAYAANQHLTYVNYYAAMADGAGSMKDALSTDGLHPNAAGYGIMQSLVQQAMDGH
jgi:lysophospholipase L1-like esterase